MKNTKLKLMLVLLAASLHSIGASAQSLRCKGDLASVGDSKGSILQKCGQPMLKDSFCAPMKPESVPGSAGQGSVNVIVQKCEDVEEWTYNPGYGQFLTTLQFKAGTLASIRYGDRVK